MLADPKYVRGKNGLQLCQIVSSLDKWEMSDGFIEIEDIECE